MGNRFFFVSSSDGNEDELPLLPVYIEALGHVLSHHSIQLKTEQKHRLQTLCILLFSRYLEICRFSSIGYPYWIICDCWRLLWFRPEREVSKWSCRYRLFHWNTNRHRRSCRIRWLRRRNRWVQSIIRFGYFIIHRIDYCPLICDLKRN